MRRLKAFGVEQITKKAGTSIQQHQLEGNGCDGSEGEDGELEDVTIWLWKLNMLLLMFLGKRDLRRWRQLPT